MTDFKTQWYVAKFEFFIDVNKIISNVMTQLLGLYESYYSYSHVIPHVVTEAVGQSTNRGGELFPLRQAN